MRTAAAGPVRAQPPRLSACRHSSDGKCARSLLLGFGFDLLHELLLEVSVIELLAVVDHLVLLQLRLQLALPLGNVFCKQITRRQHVTQQLK